MVAVAGEGYKPPTDYVENTKDSLVDLDITKNTELWLMQFPSNLGIDFDKKEVTLNLHHEGKLGSVEGSSGKEYSLVSYSSQEPEAVVFASSSSDSKFVGRISRLVSVVNYPEPTELENSIKNKSMSLSSASAMKSSRTTGTFSRSTMRRSTSKGAASTHSSRQKSALSEELGEPTKSSKKQKMSGVTSSGSMGSSHQKKSKSKMNN